MAMPLEPGTRRMFMAVAYASLTIIVAVSIYGLIEGILYPGNPVGYAVTEVYWPFPPYFAQPITYFSVACVALFYSGLRLGEETIARWPKYLLSFLQLFGFVVAFSAAYEVIYNFAFWAAAAIYAVTATGGHVFPNPDTLSSFFPSAWSYVFATRAFSALFVISGYSVYYLRRVTKAEFI